MFASACAKNRESIYCVANRSIVKGSHFASLGSGFTIAPSILATAGHLLHLDNDVNKPRHQGFNVIRAPDVGQIPEYASLIAEDPAHDIALLKINSPRSNEFLEMEPNQMPIGTTCGSLGFPFGRLERTQQEFLLRFGERFRGSYVSSFQEYPLENGAIADFYEIDTIMCDGSSGCPIFLANCRVIGMQSHSPKGRSDPDTSKGCDDNTRLSMSLLVPSMDIIRFARKTGINI